MYGFRQKREINDFQMKITDNLEWNFESVWTDLTVWPASIKYQIL